MTMPTAADGLCRNELPRGRSWGDSQYAFMCDCGQSMNGMPLLCPRPKVRGEMGARFHLAVVWFVQNCCMC